MNSFDDLVSARKEWINCVLKNWCQQACRADLLRAEPEWLDIAGKVPPEKTLWPWAWSRFPDLVHENLGIDETSEVCVALSDGRTVCGYPDSRKSQRGQLFVWGAESVTDQPVERGPFAIDDIVSVRRSPHCD